MLTRMVAEADSIQVAEAKLVCVCKESMYCHYKRRENPNPKQWLSREHGDKQRRLDY